MSLTINNNLMASNVDRNLSYHFGQLGTSTRKLSSGLRVSTAADDAAGLAISELGKAKSARLGQTKRNIQDGISLVQLADGALQIVDESLIRLQELAEQAATGTYNAHQRQIISGEMQQIVSEIERAQRALKFNGIDIFRDNSKIEIQSNLEIDDNIFVALPKTTATTLGSYMPEGLKSYMKCLIDGASIGLPVVSSSFEDVSQATLADQVISIQKSADSKKISINSEKGNNTIDGLLAEIENLEMDGIRETSAVTYANLIGFNCANLNCTDGDMVVFEINVGGTSATTYKHSFLIGSNQAETTQNFYATLDRIINDVNTENADFDLSRVGSILKSNSGKSISMGNFEYIDNPGLVIGNFGDTPINPGDPPLIPNSEISFEIDGIEVSFEYTGNEATDRNNAFNAVRSALIAAGVYYDADQYSLDADYPSPHDREHYYTINSWSNNTISVTKINLTSTEINTPNDNLIKLTEYKNNQTHAIIDGFENYTGEIISLNIEGEEISFTAAGTGDQHENANRLVDAINANANLESMNILAYENSNRVIITSTGTEDSIEISYNDENNNVYFSNFSGDIDDVVSFEIDGQNISYTIAADETDTASNLEGALIAALGGSYIVTRDDAIVRVIKNDNTKIEITSFSSTNGTASMHAEAGHGSSGTANLSQGGTDSATITDQETSIAVTAGAGSNPAGSTALSKDDGDISGGDTEISASRAKATISSLQLGTYLVNDDEVYRDFNDFILLENGWDSTNRDYIHGDRFDEGLRRVGIEQSPGSERGVIDSQHENTGQDWVSISGTGEFVLDPNVMFSVSSTVGGDANSSEAGAFNVEAGKAAQLIWESSSPQTKAKIFNFDGQEGETVSFSINGISVSFVVGATNELSTTNLESELSNLALDLANAGVTFSRTANREGIYFFGVDGTPINFDDYSGPEDSGFSVWNIDSPYIYDLNNDTSYASVESWTPLSQMNYKMQEGAQTSLSIIKEAIIQKDAVRGMLGATQNVLDNHYTFTSILKENTTAMVSQITDTDVAKEMTEFIRRQILSQAAITMLAQANSLPKMALQLIEG